MFSHTQHTFGQELSQLWLGLSSVCSMREDYRFEQPGQRALRVDGVDVM